MTRHGTSVWLRDKGLYVNSVVQSSAHGVKDGSGAEGGSCPQVCDRGLVPLRACQETCCP